MEQTKNSAILIKSLVNRPENLMWISLAAVNTGKLKDFSGAVLRYGKSSKMCVSSISSCLNLCSTVGLHFVMFRLNETAESCRGDVEDGTFLLLIEC